METRRRWQDGMNVLVGTWLFLSPWVLGFYPMVPVASWNFFVVGIAMIVFAVLAMNRRGVWGEWANFILGIWMIMSPWIVGFSANAAARANAVVFGVLAAAVSVWAYYDRHGHGGTHAITH